MHCAVLIADSLDRVHELVPAILDGLTTEDVLWRPDPGANSIGWLIWHLTRDEDAAVSLVTGGEQVWISGRWNDAFGLPYAPGAMGYGMSTDDVAAFTVPDPSVLVQYSQAVAAVTRETIPRLTDEHLDTVIDTSFTPAVTLGTRLVSIIVEVSQHIGQAAYLKGMRARLTNTPTTWAGYV